MPWLRRLSSLQRTQLLSVAGAAVLVVLCGSATAVWLYPGRIPFLSKEDGPPIRIGAQPGASSPATAPTSPTSRPSSAPPKPSATYKTIALLGLGGFDTEITVTGPAGTAWIVVLIMPADKPVKNLSPGTIKMVQEGTKVTLTPLNPPGTSTTFTVRFPALLALGQSVTSCTIDAEPCSPYRE